MKLGVGEVSELVGVPDKTVYRWIAGRKPPGYRVSGRCRFSGAEVLAWGTANMFNGSVAGLPDEVDCEFRFQAVILVRGQAGRDELMEAVRRISVGRAEAGQEATAHA